MAVAPVATEASQRRIRQPPEKAVRLQRRWWRAVATGCLVKAPDPAAPAGPAVQAAVVAVMLAARRRPLFEMHSGSPWRASRHRR